MARLKLAFLTLALATATLSIQASATITYTVGSCKPGFPSFPTISGALSATPAPNLVMVCPGTYNEQITITNGVILEGVAIGGSHAAIIVPPAGGLTQTATDDFGHTVAFQIWVNNASGPVNISNLVIDGTGNGITDKLTFLAGIFYQNSSGTMNRVITRDQNGNSNGFGIDVQGGLPTQTVAIENSFMQNFDFTGVQFESASGSPVATVAARGNVISSALCGIFSCTGIFISGVTSTVTENFISVPTGNTGIQFFSSATGAISGNTVASNGVGIADGFGAASGSSVVSITNNRILGGSVGINFGCASNPNVRSNTIAGAVTGVSNVPSLVVTPNAYFGVSTIRTGGC